MHVSLIYPYGTLPGEAWREYRAAFAARALVAAGHSVTWWVANFEHRSKTFRCAEFQLRTIVPGFDVAIVPTTGYSRHISLRRVLFERRYARRVRELSASQRRPDIIVLSEPALFTSGPITKLADDLSVPLVLDICDLWPEFFDIALPRLLRFSGRLLFAPLYARRAKLARRAAAHIAVSRDYLAAMRSVAPKPIFDVAYWGVDVSVVHRGLTADVPLPRDVSIRRKSSGDLWVMLAGSLGPSCDIATIANAAEILKHSTPSITFVIAGDGESKGSLKKLIASKALHNCVFLGSLSPDIVTRLYANCDAALCAYVTASTVSMPVKAFDYLAAGLPIVNSLGREIADFVRTDEVGLQYVAGDPVSLAAVLRTLAANTPLRARLASNAARLGQQFDWNVQYARFVEVVESALHHHSSSRTAT